MMERDWTDAQTDHPFAIKMKADPVFFENALLSLTPDELAQLFDLMEKLIENRGR